MADQPIDNLRVDSESALLTNADRAVLSQVDNNLRKGTLLHQWWEGIDKANAYQNPFKLISTFNEPDTFFGFLEDANVGGAPYSLMGVVQEMTYDHPKTHQISNWREEFQEFILHYFMRVSDFCEPVAYVTEEQAHPSTWLQPFSWCPDPDLERGGFGYSLVYYKTQDKGEVGKFPDNQSVYSIIDLREIGKKYSWIVVKAKIFNLTFHFRPFGEKYPWLELPYNQFTEEGELLIMSPEFMKNETNENGESCYGFGYATLAGSTDTGLLAFGPGMFELGFQTIHFHIQKDGVISARMAFVSNRPARLFNVSVNPVNLGFDIADLMSFGLSSRLFAPVKDTLSKIPALNLDVLNTFIELANVTSGGQAAKTLCISQDRIYKDLLIYHAMAHYNVAKNSLPTWRNIQNWLDGSHLPPWVQSGISS